MWRSHRKWKISLLNLVAPSMVSVRSLILLVGCLWPLMNFFQFQNFHLISKIPKTNCVSDILSNFDFWTPLFPIPPTTFADLSLIWLNLSTFSDPLHLTLIVSSRHLSLTHASWSIYLFIYLAEIKLIIIIIIIYSNLMMHIQCSICCLYSKLDNYKCNKIPVNLESD